MNKRKKGKGKTGRTLCRLRRDLQKCEDTGKSCTTIQRWRSLSHQHALLSKAIRQLEFILEKEKQNDIK